MDGRAYHFKFNWKYFQILLHSKHTNWRGGEKSRYNENTTQRKALTIFFFQGFYFAIFYGGHLVWVYVYMAERLSKLVGLCFFSLYLIYLCTILYPFINSDWMCVSDSDSDSIVDGLWLPTHFEPWKLAEYMCVCVFFFYNFHKLRTFINKSGRKNDHVIRYYDIDKLE